MKSLRILIVCLLASVAPLQAQWVSMKSDGDSILQRGIRFIYNVEFDQAHNEFSKVIALYPTHPAGYFLDAMVEWWRINLDQKTTSYDGLFLQKIDRVLAVCDRRLDSMPKDVAALFFKGGAIGFRGRYHITRNNYFSAADDGRIALGILQDCYRIAPGNHDVMLGTGIYNYFSVAIPERRPALSTLMMFLPSGDKQLGLAQLKAAARQARYAAVEAKVILIQAYTDFEWNLLEAMIYARDLHQSYPKNPAFQRAYGRCLVGLGPRDSAELCWRDVLVKYMDKKFGYDRLAAREALYYVGICRLQSRDFPVALKYLSKCYEASVVLDKDEPTGLMVKAYLRMGQIYDAQGKRAVALSHYKKVLDWPDWSQSHAEARRYMNTPYR
jgi:hypothetical protein